jgi:type IV pilus assembly protein PilY1
MNKLSTHARRWIIYLVSAFALIGSVGAMAATSDVYSIDEDSELSVAAPGVLANDIPPDAANSTVAAVNLTPTSAIGPTGATTFSGVLGGAGRPFQMNADGSFTYDPRGRFEFLAVGESFVDISTTADNATTRYFNSPNSGIVKVTITVTGVNDAPTVPVLSANTLSENAGSNFVIGAFSTTDVDTSDTHEYSLVAGAGSTDNGLFNVSGSSLRATNDLDAEFKTSYSIRVRVSDIRADNGAAAGGSFEKVFTISVSDVNDVKPAITLAQSFDVAEDVLNGTVVGAAAATDGDVSATTFTWSETGGPNAGRFDIDSTGTISIADNSGFDFDTPPDSYTYSVSVSDGLNISATETITINLTDVNEFLPVVTAAQSFAIAEDTANGAVVGAAAATDGDASTVFVWAQASGPNANRFNIDSGGSITVEDNSAFDFESPTTFYIYRVTVSDGVNTSPIEEITVNITDANDIAPTFTSVNTVNVDENVAAVLTVTTSDADTVGSVSYSLSGGADQLKFAVAGTGELTFSPPVDFEATEDADSNNIFLVQVRANDGVNVTDQLITVNLQNLSDTNPTGIDNSATIVEEATYSFQVSDFGFADADGDTFASVALTTLPSDGDLKLSGVAVTVPGTQVLTTDIPSLTYVPDSDGSGTPYAAFTFSVRDSSGADDATANNFSLNVTAVADTPGAPVTAAAAGNEDTAIDLTFSGALTDTDGSEILSFTVNNVPTGASLNNGTDAGGGSWNLSVADLTGLKITPKLHDDSDFALSVTATATETSNSDTATSTATPLNVTVTPVADAPTINVTAASGNEDTAISLIFAGVLVDTDGSETITNYQITGVPVGAILNQGADATGGIWNLTAAQVAGLTITPKLHDDTNFSVNVTATSTETGNADTATSVAGALAVTVTAVADAPGITVTNTAAGNEDTAISLAIAGALVDTDGSETLSFRVSNVPTGAVLNNGVDGGGGVWTLTEAQATGLTITPKLHDDSDFTVTVAAIATEGANSDAAQTTDTITITVTAVVDTPNFAVTATASGSEDVPTTLVVTSSLVDTDGSEVLTFQITGVPTGATLNNGTDAGGGVWNLVEADISSLTITNKLHDDSDFSVNVIATATDNDASTITLAPAAIAVTILAVADAPTLIVTNSVTKDEDANPWPLTIAAELLDTDGSESLTFEISGVIASATLSAGVNQGGGVWTLTEAEAETSLSLTMDTHVAENFQIDVRALATETRDSSTQFSTAGIGRINIFVTPKADPVTVTVNPLATGNEDTAIPLDISGTLVDLDGSETLTMFITGQPTGSTFSAGTDLGGGSWGVDSGDLGGLTILAVANNNDDFTLTITATATEAGNGDTVSVADTINVQIQPVNDAPTLDPVTFFVDENSINGTIVGTVTAIDVEPVGAEAGQSFTYEIDGTAFVIDNNGVITVADVVQLDAEVTPQFIVTVTANDTGLPRLSDDALITITLNGLDDNTPVAVDDDVSVDEQATLNFSVVANDTDADTPPQTLFVSEVNGDTGLVGIPIDIEEGGLVVGSLTVNGDGSATFITTTVVTVEKFTGSATYRVTDGDSPSLNEGTINITINPINDNQPVLSVAGQTAEADGISFDEDQYPSLSTPSTIIVNDLFQDLDIDTDGFLDSNTGEDSDSLVFSVVANSDPAVLQYDLNSGDLRLFTGSNVYGTSTLTLRATDTAAPSANIAFVDLALLVTVNSVNDAPDYQDTYVNYAVEEDSGDLVVDLGGAFRDADLNDSTPGDDQLTYRLTIAESPSAFVLSKLIDETGLNVISDEAPEGFDRILVIETTDSSINLPLVQDAHGEVDFTVLATDLGRPPALPAEPLPRSATGSFRVTIQGIGDDQPEAFDDHYSAFSELEIPEDSPAIYFNVAENDYAGDTPLKVILVGQSIVDSTGTEQALVSSTRLADPSDTGDFSIRVNGEVTCADQDCLDAKRGSTSISAGPISEFEIAYRPTANFNGEDSFTYCIEDSSPADEDAFTPPNDPRCATVTVNVIPQNDAPSVNENIIITMDQADDLIVLEEDGLKNFVRDIDNTHMDGLGCDPLLVTCVVAPGDPQPDRLYFYFAGALTQFGQLIAPFTDDGAFNYRPDATFAGADSFDFQVCDTPTPGDADHCAAGTVAIQITPIEGAPEGSSDGAVQFDYQLAETPLELPIGPEPNVLIVNDDSGSMGWDISTDGDSGLYQLPGTNTSLYYVNKATKDAQGVSSWHLAPADENATNQGIWRLRNSTFNTVYYNPEVRYKPWEGLDTGDVAFPDSPKNAARHNPLSSSPATNLEQTIDFTGVAVQLEEVCRLVCPNNQRRCRSRDLVEECSIVERVTTVQSNGFYIPRYYEWIDIDGDGTLDEEPSPSEEPASCATVRDGLCSEGVLVKIIGGRDYPKGSKRTDCETLPVACTYEEEMQNFANWFTYYRSREFTAKAALGVVVANAENLRVGYAKLNSESNILPVQTMNTSERTGAKAALLDAIYATNSSGGTPLRTSLRDAGRYFECKSNDIFNSSSDTSPGNSRCPVLPAPDGNCQQHFALLITDGTWSGNTSPNVGDTDANNNTNFDGGAFAGSDSNTLADVAMHYYERDLHPDVNNEVPTTSRDRVLADVDAFENSSDELMHQHMTTYTVGFGVKGLVDANPVNYATGFNWGNPYASSQRKTDDVRHAAYNGRGEYLDASNAGLLADKLVEAFDEFSQGSGAASAVSFNSQEIQQDTLIFRAFYNTKINTGDLIAQSLTDDGLLEEPVWSSAEALDSQDANSRQIMTYDAANSVGIPFRPGSLNADQRDAFVSDPSATEAQKNAEVTLRINYLRGDSANERPVGNFRERPVLEGRLGDIVHSTPVFVGAPNRVGRDQSPFPQSDLYSTFRAERADRNEVIYVAANDGMVHGFDADDGSEVFGFVPNNLILGTFSRRITELLDFEYSHKFFVDLTPAVNDVYMDSDDDGDKEWITFVMGGQGAGAKAYYALNATDPTKLTETTAAEVVLWEFTEADDTYPTGFDGLPLLTAGLTQRQDLQDTPQPVKDLGYSFSVPTIAMSNLQDGNGEQIWVSMFGNGYNSTAGIAKLFLLFIDEGVDGLWCHPDMIHNQILNGALPAECVGKQDFVKIDTGFGVKDGFPNGLGTPRGIDVDGNGTLDYAYAGDTFGNFFRFDLTSDDYDDWSFTKIYEASYIDSESNVTLQPITTQPIVTAHPTESDGFIVIFATGSFITIPDGRNKDIQSIYGLWDRLSPELLKLDDLVQQRFVNLFDGNFGNVRSLTNNDVDYSATAEGGKKGWYNHLDAVALNGNQLLDDPEFPGEKAIRNIQLRGGLAFVNSIIPRSDTSCVDIAGGFALSFCPGTGGTNCLGTRGIFDLDNDGAFDAGDKVDGQVVAGTRFEDAVPTDSSFIEDKRITQLSDKSLDSTKTNTSGGENTGRLSWKELDSIE